MSLPVPSCLLKTLLQTHTQKCVSRVIMNPVRSSMKINCQSSLHFHLLIYVDPSWVEDASVSSFLLEDMLGIEHTICLHLHMTSRSPSTVSLTSSLASQGCSLCYLSSGLLLSLTRSPLEADTTLYPCCLPRSLAQSSSTMHVSTCVFLCTHKALCPPSVFL